MASHINTSSGCLAYLLEQVDKVLLVDVTLHVAETSTEHLKHLQDASHRQEVQRERGLGRAVPDSIFPSPVDQEELSSCIASMTLSTVKQKLEQMQDVKQQAQIAIQQLIERKQQLDPSYRPAMKFFCTKCNAQIKHYIVGKDHYCGKSCPGNMRGHLIRITHMKCGTCHKRKPISKHLPPDDKAWSPQQWNCPFCSRKSHGGACGSNGNVMIH